MHRPFTSATVDIPLRRLAIVKIEAAGVVGWGEAAPVPGHTADFQSTWRQLRNAATQPDPSTTSVPQGLARAALEQALTDVEAKRAERPLWELLGATRPVPASAAIGLDANHQPDEAAIAAALAGGYRHMKLKLDNLTNPAGLRHLLSAYPDISFGADANESLTDSDKSRLVAIDELGLAYLEQPGSAEALEWHRGLRADFATPIALDEAASSEEGVAAITAVGAADIVTLKVGRFGPATTLRLAQQVIRSGLRTRLGGLLESGIGRAHTVALAGRDEFSTVGDIAASDFYFPADLVDPPWGIRDGVFGRSATPGIGVAVDEEMVSGLAFDTLIAE
jgi:O-succinylbenzoate synthase